MKKPLFSAQKQGFCAFLLILMGKSLHNSRKIVLLCKREFKNKVFIY